MTAKATRNARSRTQRGMARAAMQSQRKKVNLQEDHLTALFTHLAGIDQARLGAGEQVVTLRELGLTLGEIAELTGETVNRLSWLSRLPTDDGDNDAEGTDGASGQEVSPGGAPAGEGDADPAEERAAGGNQALASSSATVGGDHTTGGRLQV